MDVYESNLLTLATLDAGLSSEISRIKRPSHVALFQSKSGPMTVRFTREDATSITLHSRYDPLEEAEGFLTGVDTEKITTYIVLGFGLGYHIKALFAAMRRESRIIVVERDLGILRAACESVDLAELFASRRVSLIAGKSVPEIFTALKPHAVRIFLDATYLVHKPSVETVPAYYQEVHKALGDYVTYGMQNVITTVTIDKVSKTNTLMNLPWYTASPGIARFRGAYEGFPAIVVSAGPSLHRNIDMLAKAKGRAVIIAVSTVFKPLLRRGITPDFTVVLDYHTISKRYFEGVHGDSRVTLIADPKASWEAVDAHRGPKAVVHNDSLHRTIDSPPFHKGSLASATTVAHSAFYFAQHIGADPIIFVGQDLAHPDGITHVPGTAMHDLWAVEANRFSSLEMREWESILRMKNNLLRIKDIHGNDIYTDGQMFSYLQQFEVDFYNSPAMVIDATEGGAAKKYTTVMTLEEALERHATRPLGDPPPPPTDEADSTDDAGRDEIARVLEGRIGRMGQVRSFYDRTLKILKQIQELWPDQQRMAPLLAQIDEIRREVTAFDDVNALVREVAQALELVKIKADRDIISKRLDGLEKQKAQLDRDLQYIAGLRDAVEQIEKSFSQALARFRSFDYAGRIFAFDGTEEAT